MKMVAIPSDSYIPYAEVQTASMNILPNGPIFSWTFNPNQEHKKKKKAGDSGKYQKDNFNIPQGHGKVSQNKPKCRRQGRFTPSDQVGKWLWPQGLIAMALELIVLEKLLLASESAYPIKRFMISLPSLIYEKMEGKQSSRKPCLFAPPLEALEAWQAGLTSKGANIIHNTSD